MTEPAQPARGKLNVVNLAVVVVILLVVGGLILYDRAETKKFERNLTLYNEWVGYQNDVVRSWNQIERFGLTSSRRQLPEGFAKAILDDQAARAYREAARDIAKRSREYRLPDEADHDPRLVRAIRANVEAGIRLGDTTGQDEASATAVQEFEQTGHEVERVMEQIAGEAKKKLEKKPR